MQSIQAQTRGQAGTGALSDWVRAHSLVVYFVVTYVISWSFMLPVAASVQNWVSWDVPPALYYLASFGPGLAAIVVTALIGGRSGVRRLLERVVQWRVERQYLAFAFIAPLVFFGIAVAVQRLVGATFPDLARLGEMDYLPYLGIPGAIAVWLLTYGLGEEVGWRGFALPHLQRRYSARTAALILGVIWAGWHLPAFWFRDTYMQMGLLTGFPMLLVSVVFASIILAWLYNGSGGSLFVVIVFHALFNWLSVSEAGGDYVAIIMGAAAVFWAVRVMKIYGAENLAPAKKQVEQD